MAGSTPNAQSDPLKKALTHALAIWAVGAPLWVLVDAGLHNAFALDFHFAFMPASRHVLNGVSPYSAIGSAALAEGKAFLYPPLSAYMLSPFTLLPPLAAEIVAVALVAAAVPGTLLLLGVRDWRCHAFAFLWLPTIIGLQTANLTLPMLLGLAIAWRYRDRSVVVAVVTGFVIALKLFFWPVLVWLVATRRYRSAALAAVASAAFVVLPWAGIGFAGLRSYPHLLSSVSSNEGPRSYSVAALIHAVLPSWPGAVAVATVLAVALLLAALVVGRRGRDRDAFALSVVAILAFTPVLEMHYFAALLVVVALYRRKLALAWAVPVFMWGAPPTFAGSMIHVVPVLVVAAVTVAVALREWHPRRLVRALRPRLA